MIAAPDSEGRAMQRVLGVGDMLAMAGASIGPAFALATIFGPMIVAGGGATPAALVLVTAIMACIAVAYAQMGARYPTAGSAYSWVATAFGPGPGAYAAWVLVVANIFSIVAICIPAGTYTLAVVAPNLVNAVLAVGAVAAILHPVVAHAALRAPFPGNAAFVAALVVGIWMLDGWEVSASTAEEATGAASAGIGGLVGLLLTAAVILAGMLAFMRVGTLDGFGLHEGDALAYVAQQLGGDVWQRIVSITVLVSLAATLQTTLVYLTRSFFAMGRDGVLPPTLGKLDGRGQPLRATILIAATGIACTLASGISPTLEAAFDFILSATSAFLGILFILAAGAAMRIFWTEPRKRLVGVVVPAIGSGGLVLLVIALWFQADARTRIFIAVVAVLGIPLAVWRSRRAFAQAPDAAPIATVAARADRPVW
jgi:amino acid transporter